MNLAHLHLLLNHIPVIGAAFGFALLAYGMQRRNDDLMKVALIAFVVLALLAIPAYFTGKPAEKVLDGHPGIAAGAIETHENAALLALAVMELVGACALGVLLAHWKEPMSARAGTPILVLAFVLSALMAWTANLGGKIHHTEITGGAPASVEPDHD